MCFYSLVLLSNQYFSFTFIYIYPLSDFQLNALTRCFQEVQKVDKKVIKTELLSSHKNGTYILYALHYGGEVIITSATSIQE